MSSYSYQRNDRVYLEEDCDAELLMAALAQHGYNMQFTSKHSDRRSPIRSYDRFLLSFDEKALLDSVPWACRTGGLFFRGRENYFTFYANNGIK